MTQMLIITQPLQRSDLESIFREGAKPPVKHQIGVEWEKIGVFRETGEAIPYTGTRGVKAIFKALESRFGWTPVLSSSGEPIALKKGRGSITLEPGGQIELSGQQAFRIIDNARELTEHLDEIRQVSDPLGVAWLGIGAQPFSVHDKIEWVPKERYGVMRKRLSGRGRKTFWMMKETASTQVSMDYSSETDAILKLRLALALAPVLTAAFANSPLHRGRISRFLSRRADIWRHTDPDRSGIIWQAFRDDFDFTAYTDFALDVPLLFIQREGQWLAPPRMSFRRYWSKGWRGHQATLDDWHLHLTSIFTESRLKNYLEIRSIDCQATDTGLAAVALIKGLFYHPASLKAAWNMMRPKRTSDLRRQISEAPSKGLGARWGHHTLREAAQELAVMAKAGLSAEEKAYLAPYERIARTGVSPAQRLADCFGRARTRGEKIGHVLTCAAI